MAKRVLIALSFVCSLLPGLAPAATTEGSLRADSVIGGEAPPANKFDESRWYFYLGVGLGRPTYDSQIERRQADQRAMGGSSEYAGFYDVPAVYKRVDPHWGFGLVGNLALEQTARNWREHNSFAVQAYNAAVTAMYWPTESWGLGWFARSDVGYSRLVLIRERITPDAIFYHRDIASGLYTQASVGYGWRAGDEARLLAQITGMRVQAESYFMSGAAFFLGFLF